MLKKFLVSLCILCLLSSCTSKRTNIELSNYFLDNPGEIILMEISGLDKGMLYKSGPQGLVEYLINENITSDIQKALTGIDTKDIMKEYYFDAYGQALKHRKFKTKNAKKIINIDSLKPLESNNITMSPYDFSSATNTYNARYALVFQPYLFGAERPYYGFIPLGAPKGYIQFAVYLVNLEDNMLEGYYTETVENAATGEWDQSPGFSNLVHASQNALKTALKKAYNFFFVDNCIDPDFEEHYAEDAY